MRPPHRPSSRDRWPRALGTAVAGLVLAGACTVDIDGQRGEDGEDIDPDTAGIASASLRRLTRAELDATLRDLVPGVAPDPELIRGLPEDPMATFDNDARDQQASQLLIDSVNAIAEDTAARLVADEAAAAALIGCTPSAVDDAACYDAFLRRFGRRVLRRPIGDAEAALYAEVFLPIAREDGAFAAAVSGTVSALLQDVEFLYRVEPGLGVGAAGAAPLDDYQVATRLAFLLWGAGPDDALLDRAAAGGLASDGAARLAVAEAMLDDPRARRQLGRFHAMWLGYEWSLPATSAIPDELRPAMRAEVDNLFARVVLDERRSWFDVLTFDEAFLDDALAEWYGDVEAPGSDEGVWAPAGDGPRRGLLATGAFLNVGNKFVDTSPTQRGMVVRERLLCGTVPRPDPELMAEVDAEPPSDSGCKGDGYRALLADDGCGGCHRQLDPIGFGLEAYDLGGRFRTHEPAGEECPIDGDGVFITDAGQTPFNGPAELAALLAGSEPFAPCLVKQAFRFAQGRVEGADDRATLDHLATGFQAGGARLDALLLAIVEAPAFAQRTAPVGGP